MGLTLLFIGRLEDAAGTGELTLDVEQPLTHAQIAERLEPALAVAIAAPDVRIALNGQLVTSTQVTAGDGDELAFLPPVSGG